MIERIYHDEMIPHVSFYNVQIFVDNLCDKTLSDIKCLIYANHVICFSRWK